MSTIEELYTSLLLNFSTLTNYKINDKTDVGAPSATESTIALLYQLVKNNRHLVFLPTNNGKRLFDYLIEFAIDYLADELADNSVEHMREEYILNNWLNQNEKYSDYYCSNGAYNLYGVNLIQLRELLKLSKPV